jgi:anti-sigma B factor antagonist
MEISLTSRDCIPVLRVSGDIDMATAPLFDAALEEHSGGFRSPVFVDLTECPFLDSGGLNVLLEAMRRLDEPAWLGVIGASRNLRRVFDIVALSADPRFHLVDDPVVTTG